MNLRVVLLAAILAVLALTIAAYKVVVLGYEIVPRTTQDRWSVQLQVRYKGAGDNALARIKLPSDREPSQRIFDERIISDGAGFEIITHDGNKVGLLSGRLGAYSALSYRFTVHLYPLYSELPDDERIPLSIQEMDMGSMADADPESMEVGEDRHTDSALYSRWLEASARIQSEDQRVKDRLQEINRPGAGLVETLRHIHDYVNDELIDVEQSDYSDALTVLQLERGGSLGKARLAVALARAAGIPARVVAGIELKSGSQNEIHHWAEVNISGQWYALDPLFGHLGRLPNRRLVLFLGDSQAISASAVDELSFQIIAMKEEVSSQRLYRRRAAESDRILDRVSLYTLPVQTQMTLRVLLLIPFGALIVALFRNVVGVPTFGTFMPVLLALAFIETSLMIGIALLSLIIGMGWVFRRLLDWLQLLMIPRLSFLLTVVILCIVLISLLSDQAGMSAGLSAAAFPIVILTATIERFSVMIVEEGPRNAAKTTLGTLVVALACYALLMSDLLQRTVLAFPELLLAVMGVLLIIGRYTGYRLSEWTRFAAFKQGFKEG